MTLLVDTGLHDVLLYKDRLRKGLPNLRTEGESRVAVIGRLHATKVNLPGVKIVGPETVETVFLIDGPEHGNPSGIDGYLGPSSFFLACKTPRTRLRGPQIALAVIICPLGLRTKSAGL